MKKIVSISSKIAIFVIMLYQKTLSPDHGLFRGRYPYGYCRHYPSCSEYTRQAIERFGLIKGSFLGLQRIVRCNAWAPPKIDPVPHL